MDKIGYKMDMSDYINQKLDFEKTAYQQMMRKLSIIDTFKGAWQSIESTETKYLRELRKIATIESIGSSTRIEGATLTDQAVEKLLKSVKINKLETRDEQEVIGYYEALQVILDNYQEIDISERCIHQLHGMLLKYRSKDQSHRGKYKNLSNQVVANYPRGIQKIIFRTTEPHLTASEMERLIYWTREEINKQEMHPLIIVAVFVYEFLSIHPYQDGNGRLSRLLTTLLLMQQGYKFVQYISFEHVIEVRKEAYYRALMEGQKNRYKDNERVDNWILFFLDSLIELTNRLEAKHATYSKLKFGLNARQQEVLNYIKKYKTAQISDIEKGLKKYSRNTLKKDLQYLLQEGFILKTGAGRGVHYHDRE